MENSAPSKEKYIYISAEVAGTKITIARKNLEYEESEVDHYLFEPDYTIAGSTGFLLWPGSWLLLDLLRGALSARLHGQRVLELGSGTGLAGLCAAAAGAHVLMTDLPSVVHGILADNLQRNNAADLPPEQLPPPAAAIAAPDFPGASQSQPDTMPCSSKPDPLWDGCIAAGTSPWAGSIPIGARGGSAACMPLDWSEPLEQQTEPVRTTLGLDVRTADMLIACDVVWLKELLHPFRDTVVGLLRKCRPATPCLLIFLDRAKDAGRSFSSRAEVAAVFEEQGCRVRTYHSGQQADADGELLVAEVMEITLIEGECRGHGVIQDHLRMAAGPVAMGGIWLGAGAAGRAAPCPLGCKP